MDPAAASVTRTATLLRLMLAGDLPAQRRLFERHRPMLAARAARSAAMGVLRRHVSAEDLVGEVYLRALESGCLLRFEDRGPGSLDGLLLTLLDRVIADACRRHGAVKRGANVRRVDGDPSDMTALQASDPSPTGLARASELEALCRQHLSEREWEAFRLVQCDGLSAVEAAERLGSTDSAVRGLLLRARARLIKLLADPREPP